ncbi:Stk1 family PASTA domain-containing Ser/Thr kinase [Ornithinimicrobium pratense]|uniref:non-specific serine/threonine protein kinase n=1 Tax=Ornithinimicrobium pratense TaxID=2593973 RepID=A0A5J6V1E0_9MICO|nr:Stk1 family PASTA domain-containing Ser/Thr kinase [Ornithinimicrobium pratense]QFG67367.1 Stk1 family PASTA domain-containing Ser/Thr kinase [Ornithinimicrobium pratense]
MSDDPTEAAPQPPQQDPRLLGGRYELGALIGRGGMADVHLGHDLRLGRTVAIKILRTDLARDSSFLSRFRREAQAAAGLSHPSIVAVFDSGEEIVEESGGAELHVPYIVMEYIEGKTLREVLNEQESLGPEEASRITATVLSAMQYAHERGLVHRDIKPANVMVTEAGGVKVMDFGIARALADTAATMTQTQAVMGTARYLSPEQAQGLDVDGRSDLYSVGCLLYELLAGRTPFQGDPVSLVYQHLGETPKVPSTHRPIPEELDAITVHALEKRPEDRYQDADDFRADLNAFRAGEPLSDAATASLQSVLAARAGGAVAGGAGAGAVAHATQPVARSQSQGDHSGYASPVAGLGVGRASYDDDRYERTDELPVRERRHPGAVLLLGAMSLLAVAGLAWVLYLVLGPGADDGPPMVAVPSTVGSTEAAARTQLVGLGFVVPESRFQEDEQPSGTVIDQMPLTGEAPEGAEIRLVVSSGPAALAIPRVQGMEEGAARAQLERAGFTNVREGVEQENDPDWARGEVIDTTPAAGNEIARDDEIVLTVSSGQVEVPDVVGETRDDAVLALFQQSLRPEIEEEPTADVEPGTVLRQSAEAGAIVDQGSPVTLTVAIEPPTAPTTIRETITATPTPTPPEPTSPPEPTEPTSPPEPTEPTSPPEPTEPTSPPEPTEPTSPPEPTEPSSPPDPTGPGAVPPGQGGVPPGQGGSPPGQGDPPGRGDDPPGRGNPPRP